MDVIVTAIIIGFLVVTPIKVAMDFAKKYRKFAREELEQQVTNNTLTIRVDEVKIDGQEDPLILVFNALNGKFVTQGSADDIKKFIVERCKNKSVFLLANDTVILLKPAEIQ